MPDFSERECSRSSNVRGRILQKGDQTSRDGLRISYRSFRLATGDPQEQENKQDEAVGFAGATSPNPTQAVSFQRPVTDLVVDLWGPEVVWPLQ